MPLVLAFALVACGGSDASGGGGGGIAVVGTSGSSATPVSTPTSTPSPSATGTPTPMPMPTTSGVSVASPSLDGLPIVPSGVNTAQLLTPSWGTGAIASPEDGQVEGAFRFICSPSHNAYDDPIVYPGQPGKAHLHTFFGNSKADANSTYASLRTTGDSTCNNILNRSAYWIPALMNTRGKVIMPNWVSIYYKGMPTTNPRCAQAGRKCLSILPRGLRYIFGYNMSNPANSTTHDNMWWNCDAPNSGGHFYNIAQAAKGCPVGAHIGVVLTGPDCWNGTELDSADHRSHMAYMKYDDTGQAKCPATHPYILPHFTIGAWYEVDATLDRSGDESATANTWYLSSDRMPGMQAAVPGTTLHADWFGAWEDDIMSMWIANCIDKMLSCAAGDLGNGKQLKTISGYDNPTGTIVMDPPAIN